MHGTATTPARLTPGSEYSVSGDAVVEAHRTHAENGLSHHEAQRRAAHYGPNELPRASGPGVLRRWFDQVRNPLIVVLIIAGTVTMAIGHHVDAAVIFGVVVLNAIVGYVQESRARQALDALTTLVRTVSTVVREGQRHRLASTELVPGDIVLMEAGDRVPADARLLNSRDLECDESALTGESVPVGKSVDPVTTDAALADRTSMVYSGTLVTRGTATVVAVGTGTATEIGTVAGLTASAVAPLTPLTRKLVRFSKQLAAVIVAVGVITFVIGLARGTDAAEMFVAAVALAVAAIPEGLPAAVTVVLAIGVVRMARRKAIVRHLPAVETLGSTTVICSDKTGTITANALTVVELTAGDERYSVTGTGFTPEGAVHHRDEPVDILGHPTLTECLVTAALCNDAELRLHDGQWRAVGDPTEVALLTVAAKAGLQFTALRARAPRVDVLPFESGRRLMATVNQETDGTRIGHAKGAVERIVEWSSHVMTAHEELAPIDKEAVLAQAHAMATEGLRVLACARFTLPSGRAELDESTIRGNLTLLGLIAMRDVPRPGVVGAISACQRAGVAVKMITGDHPETARRIAAEVGLGPRKTVPVVVTGAQLSAATGADFDAMTLETDVFARVSPEQKLRLVEAFQRHGHVVAMTGDGVNDAPALRRADIGVAMGRGGTEAARDAADMVLADDDFSSIEAAVEEGRSVFDNLRKFITWTLPTNVGQGMVILTAIVFGMTLPILPVQILWINMTTAVFLGLTLAFEPRESAIMARPPRPPSRPLLTTDLVRRILLVSTVMVLGAFAVFEFLLQSGQAVEIARTAAISVVVSAQTAFLFACRSLDAFLVRTANWWLFCGVAFMWLLQVLLTYAPIMQTLFHTAALPVTTWLLVLVVGAITYVVVELDKALWRRSDRRAEGTGMLATDERNH